MPYISAEDRVKFLDREAVAETPGELNYLFTVIAKGFLDKRYKTNGKVSYQDMNDVLGALEGCKIEFYRRVVAALETQKIQENGDVW